MSSAAERSLPAEATRALDALLDALARRIVELQAELDPETARAGEATPWLSVDEAAAHLGWPRQRLYRLTAAGAIPHYKHGRRLLFRAGELDAWLAAHRQAPVGE